MRSTRPWVTDLLHEQSPETVGDENDRSCGAFSAGPGALGNQMGKQVQPMVSDPPYRRAVVDVGVVAEGEDPRILHPAWKEVPGPAYRGLFPCVDIMPVKAVHEHNAERCRLAG